LFTLNKSAENWHFHKSATSNDAFAVVSVLRKVFPVSYDFFGEPLRCRSQQISNEVYYSKLISSVLLSNRLAATVEDEWLETLNLRWNLKVLSVLQRVWIDSQACSVTAHLLTRFIFCAHHFLCPSLFVLLGDGTPALAPLRCRSQQISTESWRPVLRLHA